MKNKFKRVLVVLIILNMILSNAYGIAPIYEKAIVSYGTSIILKTMQILQFILPVILLVSLFLKDVIKRKVKITKLIIYFIISIMLFGIILYAGELVLNHAVSYSSGYSSGRINMFKYNGAMIYIHK